MAVREAVRKMWQSDAIARALGAKKRKIDAEKKERQNAAKEELEREREKLSKEYTLEAVQGDDKVKKKPSRIVGTSEAGVASIAIQVGG